MTANLPSIKASIQRHDLMPKKALGQHFLLDETITQEITRLARIQNDEHVIEVGPGPGGLTRPLLESKAAKVTIVEMDHRAIALLAELKPFYPDKLEIIEGDALKQDLTVLTQAPRSIVANLPYNVGTLLLIRWLHEIHAQGAGAYRSLTLMFQKEVAERIVAEPNTKDFGRLSVLAQWLCKTSYLLELPPAAFYPPPKVESAIVQLIPRDKPLVDVSLETLELVMAKAFGQRRKMLRSALKGLPVAADQLLEKAGIDGTRRAEALSVEELCHLAKTYETLK